MMKLHHLKYSRKWICIYCVRNQCSAADNKLYFNTIIFPKTDFPMRPTKTQHTDIQKAAGFSNLYNWQRENVSGKEFVLHDGPPYANGDLHMGHAVNKIIKDICNRGKLIQGHKVHYVPGWDCHGLPIELKALQKSKKDSKTKTKVTNPIEIRQIAREFALEAVNKQKNEFVSWGVMADWETQCYMTINTDYVVRQLGLFVQLFDKGLVYRALKPVYWSPVTRTALAEAELEYDKNFKSKEVYVKFPFVDIPEEIRNIASKTALAEAELEYDKNFKSKEVYVKFPFVDIPEEIRNIASNKKISAIIWTTTPWSLVTNKAICYSSQLKYSVVNIERNTDECYVIATSLVEHMRGVLGCSVEVLGEFDGPTLSSATYHNKLVSSTLPFFHGDHVSSSKGTGLVHTAPAHGPEDFLIALKNNISVECHVDEDGRYTNLNPSLNGLYILDEGQQAVMEMLSPDILHQGVITHSYPLDWRSKTPVIIRASHQWFIDTDSLKEKAAAALESVSILPPSSSAQWREGLVSMVRSRPYWCISRQRSWGVPVPVVYHRGEAVVDHRIVSNLCALMETRGPDVWWECDVTELVPETVVRDRRLDMNDVVKGTDIMDIWFDSGVSWSSLGDRQADLYCEGLDQFTGWFQASLLTRVAVTQGSQPPYRSIFVHGFVVDGNKRKMSKSVGNVIEPNTIINGGKNKNSEPAYGIDTLRWWVASHATQATQIIISKKMIEDSFSEVKRIRKIFRYLLGTISDMEKEDFDQKPVLNYFDRYMLKETYDYFDNIFECYNTFRYNHVAQNTLNFISNKLSSLYFQCIKDRMYCSGNDSGDRLAAQLVNHTVFTLLCKSLGPILPHLVEEAWQHHPLHNQPFFFTQNIPILNKIEVETNTMKSILEIKKDICSFTKSEDLKKFELNLRVDAAIFDSFERLNEPNGMNDSVLCEVLEMSAVCLEKAGDLCGKLWSVEVSPSKYKQCLRCRKYNALEESDKCLRCENVLLHYVM